jgi:hypothetical protein
MVIDELYCAKIVKGSLFAYVGNLLWEGGYHPIYIGISFAQIVHNGMAPKFLPAC